MADKYIQRSMQIQVSDASYIIRKALAECGGELCIEAVISAMDQISNDLKHIGLQTLMTNEALKGYWTSGGHFICAWKYSNKYIYCNDPASGKRTHQNVTDFVKQRKQFFCFFPNAA